MERVKYLKMYGGRILPGFVFNYDMTAEEIALYLENNREDIISLLSLPILDDDEFEAYHVDNYTICVGNDDEYVNLEIDYTQVIQKDWE